MERKILWLISFALLFILWLKIEPAEDSVSHQSQKQVSESTSDKASDRSGEATADEKSYFKAHPIKSKTPDFLAIKDIKQRKMAFFNFLTPFVDEKNTLLLAERKRLIELRGKAKNLSRKDKNWVSGLMSNYKLDKVETISAENINELLTYVDIVPVSLVLAQAANESAWGTSRFATDGNNFFGQWCFRKGCGLVPESRDDDADHEVRKFRDARESVFAYIDNLNSNNAYKELRGIRTDLRDNNAPITGLALVHGLDHYSQRGQDYVDEIEGLIQYNKLWRFNASNRNKENAEK
ncbi:MAG: glucosaminidase domain-containing protein [Marinomonas sp.]|jgi:Bax protein